jgi:uncharacterized peroxidase-related enzyme
MSGPVRGFTTGPLVWRPYLSPIRLEEATPAQREALQETPSNTKVSDYVLVLAHDPESLLPRTRLFNAIMYGRGGLPRAERELGATAASVVNRCIYCASVHATRYNQLTRQPEVMDRIFAQEEAIQDPDPRRLAILNFSMRLSRCPPEATGDDIVALRAAGLDDAEILDLILSVALFGWANRLMHTLGEPIAASQKPA